MLPFYAGHQERPQCSGDSRDPKERENPRQSWIPKKKKKKKVFQAERIASKRPRGRKMLGVFKAPGVWLEWSELRQEEKEAEEAG